MYDPRPPEPTPLRNSLSERFPWKCEEPGCTAIHESLDDPGARIFRDGRTIRVCWKHIRGDDAGGNHDGE